MVLRLIQNAYNGLLGLCYEPQPFYDTAQVPWIAEVERHWREIREEAVAVLERQVIPSLYDLNEQEILKDDTQWNMFFLYIYGRPVPENCALCPRTVEALRFIPGMATAVYSILQPGRHLPAHRGPFRGVLRFHLPLIVPKDFEKCGLRVDEEIRRFEEGKSLYFDDWFDHEAWNASDEVRAVLFVDVLRPLPWPMSWINKCMVFAIGWIHPQTIVARHRARKFARRKKDAAAVGDAHRDDTVYSSR